MFERKKKENCFVCCIAEKSTQTRISIHTFLIVRFFSFGFLFVIALYNVYIAFLFICCTAFPCHFSIPSSQSEFNSFCSFFFWLWLPAKCETLTQRSLFRSLLLPSFLSFNSFCAGARLLSCPSILPQRSTISLWNCSFRLFLPSVGHNISCKLNFSFRRRTLSLSPSLSLSCSIVARCRWIEFTLYFVSELYMVSLARLKCVAAATQFRRNVQLCILHQMVFELSESINVSHIFSFVTGCAPLHWLHWLAWQEIDIFRLNPMHTSLEHLYLHGHFWAIVCLRARCGAGYRSLCPLHVSNIPRIFSLRPHRSPEKTWLEQCFLHAVLLGKM